MPNDDPSDPSGRAESPRFDLAAVPDIEVIDEPPPGTGPSGRVGATAPDVEAITPEPPAEIGPRVRPGLIVRSSTAPLPGRLPAGPQVPGGDLEAIETPGARLRERPRPTSSSSRPEPAAPPAPRPTPMTRVSEDAPEGPVPAPDHPRSERVEDEPAPPITGDAASGAVDLEGAWTIPADDPGFEPGPTKGRLSRLVRGLRVDGSARPHTRMSYRGAAMDAPAASAPAPAPPAPEVALSEPLASPLLAVLDARVDEDDVVFTHGDIEVIIGRPLPEVASVGVRWWMLPGQPWRRAGYAATLDPQAGNVTFHRL